MRNFSKIWLKRVRNAKIFVGRSTNCAKKLPAHKNFWRGDFMQTIEDLHEILSAVQEIGAAWQNQNVSLRAENSRLTDENKTLRENYERLHRENENLRREISNLSEKIEQFNNNLRDEIIRELNAVNRDDFQNFVRDYLRVIREQLDRPSEQIFGE